MLVPRTPVKLGDGLPTVEVDWKRLLTNSEQSFLTDNQLSAFVHNTKTGLQKLHFYPLPFAHEFADGKWDYGELTNHNSLITSGPTLDFEPEATSIEFWPHLVRKTMTSPGVAVNEACTVSGNTVVLTWDISGLDIVGMSFSLPHLAGEVHEEKNGFTVSVKDCVYAAVYIAGSDDISFEFKNDSVRCEAQIRVGEKTICVAISCGYDKAVATASAQRSSTNPEVVFESAEKTWHNYFTKVVPNFQCSDENLRRLYYYQAYVTRANFYDIPYEPFTHPYTCPWKTGAIWQWSWNTPMNSVCERWLNDKSVGAGGILLEGDNGGGLNIGSHLQPLRKATELRGHNEHNRFLGQCLKALPASYDLSACTTLPHTTPNGLLGAWEFYLCSGDREFLRQALDIMLEAEAEFSRSELDNGLCTCSFVDEFDYSLRLKPFIKAFKKADPAMMMKMDTPFIAVDYNCYLHSLRERIIDAAKILDRTDVDIDGFTRENVRLKNSINRHLWDDADGFYYDGDPRDMSRSGVKCIAGFSALYTGIASPEEAKRLVEHLTNPSEFGTPYPCPSISVDTPDVDPSIATYGGDCLITSGIYFTVEGLMRYGYTDLAARYILKTVEMLTLDGPSSAYSYHCETGHYNQDKHTLAAQSGIVTDMICKHLLGLKPTAGGDMETERAVLESSGIENFTFGPFAYRDTILTARWQDGKYELHKEER